MRKRSLIFAVLSSTLLLGLLKIPLNGEFDNTFIFSWQISPNYPSPSNWCFDNSIFHGINQ